MDETGEPRAPERSNTWDTKNVEQCSDWKNSSDSEEKKAATRLQDLSLGGMDDEDASKQQQQQSKENQTWPFEEPCAWHGGKNTRPTKEADEINKSYFDPDFRPDKKMDFEGAEGEKNGAQVQKDPPDDDESSSADSSSIEDDNSSYESDTEADSFCLDDEHDGADHKAMQHGPPSNQVSRGGNDTTSATGRPAFERGSSHRSRKTRSDKDVKMTDAPGSSSFTENRQPLRQPSLTRSSSHGGVPSRNSSGDYTNMMAWNKGSSDHSMGEAQSDDKLRRKAERRGSTGVTSNAGGTARPKRRDDDMSSSCHGNLQTQSKHSEDLSSTTSRSSSSSQSQQPASSRSRPKPPRTKSSDGSELIGSNTTHGTSRPKPPRTKSSDGSDLIGSNTTHGTGSSSRAHRGGKRRSSKTLSSSKPPGERRMLKRAMSTCNVTRPEEYAKPGRGSGSDTDAPMRDSKHERGVQRKSSGRPKPQRSKSHIEQPTGPPSGAAVARPGPSASSSSSRTSSSHHKHSGNSGHGSRNPDAPAKAEESAGKSGPRRGVRGSGSHRKVSAESEPRRDLLVLLREQRKVTEPDLLDKENRRFLHSLMYKHKMGIPLKELQKVIRMEQEEGAVA